MAFLKQIIQKYNASTGVGSCITLPAQFGFAETHLMHAAKSFNYSEVARWELCIIAMCYF